jgi:light-regulated signal transduction histidine kinase (bacteriophytochrome)
MISSIRKDIMATSNNSLEEELTLVRKELGFEKEQNKKLFAELIVARNELSFQNEERGKREAELGVANIELVFQNNEKEMRASELSIANIELVFQNNEKEKRAEELVIINTELLAFNYISSHDLQEPLRKIQTLAGRILEKETKNLTEIGKDYFHRIQLAAGRMRQLIEDLLVYSRTNIAERKFEIVDLNLIIDEVKAELKENIEEKHAVIEATEMCDIKIIPFQFRQLMHNLLRNALKFSSPKRRPHILIKSRIVKGKELKNAKLVGAKSYCHISVSDNGIGFEPEYKDRIFEVFQKLHGKEKYDGTGIGLAIVKKIVENHNGIVTATGKLNKGATFDIYIPMPEN